MASRAPAATFSADVVRHFAPIVEFAKGEKYLPASAQWFLNRSSLEWHNDDGCGSDVIRPPGVWHRAEMSSLGTGAYTTVNRDGSCRQVGRPFSTKEHTRPTDGNRPPGLAATDGFVLNLRNDSASRGGIGDTTPEDRQRYTGAPVYYEDGSISKAGAPVDKYKYLTYWFFYPYDDGPGPQNHEGDWEGMSIVFGKASPGHYAPVALGLNQHRRTESVPWAKRLLSGDRLLVYSGKGTHATYNRDWLGHFGPFGDTVGGDVRWDTSTWILPLATQPWLGYCGGWGEVGFAAKLGIGDTTGPLGAGCSAKSRILKSAIPKEFGSPVPAGQGSQTPVVVDP